MSLADILSRIAADLPDAHARLLDKPETGWDRMEAVLQQILNICVPPLASEDSSRPSMPPPPDARPLKRRRRGAVQGGGPEQKRTPQPTRPLTISLVRLTSTELVQSATYSPADWSQRDDEDLPVGQLHPALLLPAAPDRRLRTADSADPAHQPHAYDDKATPHPHIRRPL